MVQGLAFLSKKSWHTKNVANQEKVWIAEERKRAEEEKTKELAKQIRQEKEEEELEEITGQKKKLDRGIDWMYQGQNPESAIAQEDAKKEAEEYLLGKEYVPEQAPKGDLDAENTSEGLHAVMASAEALATAEEQDSKPPAYAEPSVHDRNEAFTMRHEDPMFAVSKKAQEKHKKYEDKKALYERVTGGVAVDVDENERSRNKKSRKHDRDERRTRKRAKKEKKHRKHKQERRSHKRDSDHHRRRRRSRSRSLDSRSLSDGDDRSDHSYHRRQRSRRGRSRSRSWDRCDPRGRRSPSYERSTRRRSRSRSVDSFGERHRAAKIDRHRPSRSPSNPPRGESRRDSGRYKDQYSRSSSVGGYKRRSRYDEIQSDRSRASSRDRRSSHNHRPSPEDRKQPPSQLKDAPPKPEGYGLQGKPSTAPLDTSELGPSKELLEKKRREKEEERRRLQEESSSRRYRTPEERAAALRAMERNAQVRDETRKRHSSRNDDEGDGKAPRRGDAAFLRHVRQATHGVDGNGHSMAERLKQNRYTNQRSGDGDFL